MIKISVIIAKRAMNASCVALIIRDSASVHGLEPIINSRYSIAMQPHRVIVIVSLFAFFLFHQTLFATSHSYKQDSIPEEHRNVFPVSGFAAFSVNAMAAESAEYVYQHGTVLSKLRWPLNPAVSYSVHAGLYFPKGIFFDGALSFVQPMRTGTMIDRDFEEATAVPPRPGVTKFSEHNCDIIDGIRGIANSVCSSRCPEPRRCGKTVFRSCWGP